MLKRSGGHTGPPQTRQGEAGGKENSHRLHRINVSAIRRERTPAAERILTQHLRNSLGGSSLPPREASVTAEPSRAISLDTQEREWRDLGRAGSC